MNDVREHLTDALSSRYAVDQLIGTGGMATVYLARDLKHDRQVALKVLNPELGAVLGADRFLAEIKVTANLQHPNLLPLFDSGDADGLLFYVMPYVEGESLRARLDREKQLPVDEALRLAIAIASALDYAHRRGVIHSDLKPENILLHEGQPLVADFGIALAVSKAGGNRVTQTGLSLGTPQYMSPEQATGDRVIDARADSYSLGAVLYEMLTGDPPHLGSTAQAIIAKVLTEKPPHVRLARDAVSENVDRAIDKALAKLPADRFASAREFADALQGKGDGMLAPSGATSSGEALTRSAALGSSWPWIIALVLAVALGAWGTLRHAEMPTIPVRFFVELPPHQDPEVLGIALSPDASKLVYAGALGLMVRSMGDLDIHLIPGTANASAPFFSPDGKWVAFLADARIKKVPVGGGTPAIVVDSLESVTGGAWTADGNIIFTGTQRGLSIVSSGGGRPRTVTHPAAGDRHMWPQVLPDGKGIVFTIWHGAIQTAEIAVTTLDGQITRLGIRGIGPRYLDGHLIFAHEDGSLAMVQFDATRRIAGTDEVPLGEVISVGNPGSTDYALSPNGALVYLRGALPNQPVIVDRSGTSRPLPLDERTYARPRFSPDGRRLLIDTRGAAFGEIWLYDIGTSTLQRLYAGEDVHQAEWRPDGKALAFTARNDTTAEDIFTMPVDGSARPQAVLKTNRDQYDATWTPDGSSLVYLDDDPFQIINVLRLDDHQTSKWLEAGASGGTLLGPRVSPDGRWLAYWSNQSGRPEVYVRAFPKPGGVVQVSSQGGTEPVWARNGHELFFREDDKLMVADLATTPDFAVSGRRLLFAQPFVADGGHAFYDVSPDGKSFVFLKNTEQQARLVVVLNWAEELKRKFAKQ